ncbi:putative membrane protein [Thermoplasmatales archaeon BRNA1]|nr:putative membrane protein [Thermoplasmatales archaeon BRNA1]
MNWTIFLAVYVLLNVTAFLAYGWDKHKAKNDKWRTKESTLLALALLGAFGGLSGMYAFHHKTRKGKFKLVWLFVVLHIILIAAIVCYL